jgi:multidrug efflux pump subunit AcrA (membrane-fusion protein)
MTVACNGTGDDDTPSAETASAATAPAALTPPVRIEAARAVEQPIARFMSVTGTLAAQEEAEVAAEIAGRVVATPVERGMPLALGAELVRISATEVEAQALEAEANAAQIVARLGRPDDPGFSVDLVPEVAAAQANRDLTRADYERITALFSRQLVSKAELEMRRAQAESAQRQYETARNGVEQQRQALAAARARLTLAKKALADTVVRAPFAGVVAERLVSVGDYVTRGTKVVSVLRVNPLRVQLTVPAQYIAAVAEGRGVALQVDAYPGQTFTGRVRYVSPDVRADSRALMVEAMVPNDKGLLKPGLFVTARIVEKAPSPGVLVPSSAVQTASDVSRVFVVTDNRVEERIVTTGQQVARLVEVTSGVKAGDTVATSNLPQLADGTRVAVQ